jgi:hypothetical protein
VGGRAYDVRARRRSLRRRGSRVPVNPQQEEAAPATVRPRGAKTPKIPKQAA